MFLLDINVLIALLDPLHIQHEAAHDWFGSTGRASWATCPLTQNGVLRIVGHPKYPGSPGSPAAVVPLLSDFCALPGHVFWPDSISLLGAAETDATRLLTPGQVTDTYLLALARSRKGRLASFDRRLVTSAVPDGRQTLLLLEDGN